MKSTRLNRLGEWKYSRGACRVSWVKKRVVRQKRLFSFFDFISTTIKFCYRRRDETVWQYFVTWQWSTRSLFFGESFQSALSSVSTTAITTIIIGRRLSTNRRVGRGEGEAIRYAAVKYGGARRTCRRAESGRVTRVINNVIAGDASRSAAADKRRADSEK